MVFLRFLGILFIVQALMLLGADAISTLERNEWVMRSMTEVLALFRSDPTAWLNETLPGFVAGALNWLLSLPGWAVLGALGLLITLTTRGREDRGGDRMGEID